MTKNAISIKEQLRYMGANDYTMEIVSGMSVEQSEVILLFASAFAQDVLDHNKDIWERRLLRHKCKHCGKHVFSKKGGPIL